eukprot:TRINITY_DN10098_c0_g1_i2.p1 TRINITY_DN10098_c0_g1~~TRINITY_DN10098_c0_g1_i2.p1  ORF type:complete len:1420 (-),score=330.66 TRINITY_DN10098_c0_g1_i2:275-4534(-)
MGNKTSCNDVDAQLRCSETVLACEPMCTSTPRIDTAGRAPLTGPAGAIFQDTLEGLSQLEMNLMQFAAGSNATAVLWLLELGAYVQACDSNCSTCLHVACRSGSLAVIQVLLAHAVDRRVPATDTRELLDVNVQDCSGWTPLHISVFMGRYDAVKPLLLARADVERRTFAGQTSLELCSDARTRSLLCGVCHAGPAIGPSGAFVGPFKHRPVEEDFNEFTVKIEKRDKARLGLKVTNDDLTISRIEAGLIQEWNSMNPMRSVEVGDCIVSVNGKIQSPRAILGELKSAEDLKILVQRGRCHAQESSRRRDLNMPSAGFEEHADGAHGSESGMHFEPFFVSRAPVIHDSYHDEVFGTMLREVGQAIFNEQPGRGLAFLVATGRTRDYPIDLVALLRSRGFDPEKVGTFLGQDFSLSKILRMEFLNSIGLFQAGIVESLHKAFSNFAAPPDLQKVDRLAASLAEVWWRQHLRRGLPAPAAPSLLRQLDVLQPKVTAPPDFGMAGGGAGASCPSIAQVPDAKQIQPPVPSAAAAYASQNMPPVPNQPDKNVPVFPMPPRPANDALQKGEEALAALAEDIFSLTHQKHAPGPQPMESMSLREVCRGLEALDNAGDREAMAEPAALPEKVLHDLTPARRRRTENGPDEEATRSEPASSLDEFVTEVTHSRQLTAHDDETPAAVDAEPTPLGASSGGADSASSSAKNGAQGSAADRSTAASNTSPIDTKTPDASKQQSPEHQKAADSAKVPEEAQSRPPESKEETLQASVCSTSHNNAEAAHEKISTPVESKEPDEDKECVASKEPADALDDAAPDTGGADEATLGGAVGVQASAESTADCFLTDASSLLLPVEQQVAAADTGGTGEERSPKPVVERVQQDAATESLGKTKAEAVLTPEEDEEPPVEEKIANEHQDGDPPTWVNKFTTPGFLADTPQIPLAVEDEGFTEVQLPPGELTRSTFAEEPNIDQDPDTPPMDEINASKSKPVEMLLNQSEMRDVEAFRLAEEVQDKLKGLVTLPSAPVVTLGGASASRHSSPGRLKTGSPVGQPDESPTRPATVSLGPPRSMAGPKRIVSQLETAPTTRAKSSSLGDVPSFHEVSGLELRDLLGSPDVLRQLLFSTIMLNCNLHEAAPTSPTAGSPAGKQQRMSKEEWMQFNKSVLCPDADAKVRGRWRRDTDLLRVLERIYNVVQDAKLPGMASVSKASLDFLDQEDSEMPMPKSPLAEYADVEGFARVLGGTLPSAFARTADCWQIFSEATASSRRCHAASPSPLATPGATLLPSQPRSMNAGMGLADSAAFVLEAVPALTDAVWLSLCRSLLFLSVGPVDGSPFAFVHLGGAQIAGIEPARNTFFLDGGVGDPNGPRLSLQMVFLLPDGRWQAFEVPQLSVEVREKGQLEAWVNAITSSLSGATGQAMSSSYPCTL